jgi:V8-like Glu-specific endopeptidase
MTKLSLLGFSALAIFAVGCMAPPSTAPEEQGETHDKILGGTDDTGHTSVAIVRVFIDANSWQQCTGTLIAPNMVMTAGHCAFNGQQRLSAADVSFSNTPDQSIGEGASGYLTGAIVPNPAYTGALGAGQDVSVVVLDAPVQGRAAMAIGNAPTVGSSVTAVGYGRNQQGTENVGSGVKRQVSIAVSAVTDHEITAGQDNLGTCHGDSGGPIIQNNTVVGIVSYGDTADCHGASHFTRTDDIADFLQEVADAAASDNAPPAAPDAPAPATGKSCSTVIQCINGSCTCGQGAANAGKACDGQLGTANSCSDVCSTCN